MTYFLTFSLPQKQVPVHNIFHHFQIFLSSRFTASIPSEGQEIYATTERIRILLTFFSSFSLIIFRRIWDEVVLYVKVMLMLKGKLNCLFTNYNFTAFISRFKITCFIDHYFISFIKG